MRQLPAPVQRWLTILLPPFCLLVCCFVMLPRHKELRRVRKQIQTSQASITDYLAKLQAIRDLPPAPKIATLPFTKEEQSGFLRGLQSLCDRTGNRFQSVTSLAAPAPTAAPASSTGGGANAKAKVQEASLPPDVVEIKSTLTFQGTFTSLRAILAALDGARRMISLQDCKVTPGKDGDGSLTTALAIARYVDAPSGAVRADAAKPGVRPGGPTG